RVGVHAVRGVAIALDVLQSECRSEAGAQRWRRPLAVAFAARALSRHLHLGLPLEAFTLGLVHGLGPQVLAAWRMPAHLVQVATPLSTGDRGFDPDEDELVGLARILGQASLLADALHGDPALSSVDWARASSGLEALREILEMDRGS